MNEAEYFRYKEVAFLSLGFIKGLALREDIPLDIKENCKDFVKNHQSLIDFAYMDKSR